MSQGNITMTPMASGGGLTDLILLCLVFGVVPFWKVSPWLLMALRICKKGRWARRSLYRFQCSNSVKIGIPGNIRVLEVRITWVTKGGNRIG